jgi:hypothetical protein
MQADHEQRFTARLTQGFQAHDRVLVLRPLLLKDKFRERWGCGAVVEEVVKAEERRAVRDRLRWITPGYSGEAPGDVSKHLWRAAQLKPLLDEHTDKKLLEHFRLVKATEKPVRGARSA